MFIEMGRLRMWCLDPGSFQARHSIISTVGTAKLLLLTVSGVQR